MTPLKIATLCGSLRKDSYNRKLLLLGEDALSRTGAHVDAIDLRDYPLPPYDGDLEAQGMPERVIALKARIAAAEGIVIACPEYNHSIPGGFKNMLDWTSRQGSPWKGKVAGMMGASDGPFGTWRMMPQLRTAFTSLRVLVIPEQVNVRDAPKVWDDNGKLLDEKLSGVVEKFVAEFVRVAQNMRAS
jgi:chromate reductase, NAD(P)H dehydrogenase (quinone)